MMIILCRHHLFSGRWYATLITRRMLMPAMLHGGHDQLSVFLRRLRAIVFSFTSWNVFLSIFPALKSLPLDLPHNRPLSLIIRMRLPQLL
jgi:hypothetical protein